MVGIIDYGVGNLYSLESSFREIGQEIVVSDDRRVLGRCDHLILPGVGAFSDAVQKLRLSGLDTYVTGAAGEGIPLMGICLGMQMLFETSYEYGEHRGLGLLKGKVVPMQGRIPQALKIPHMGWNRLDITDPGGRLLAGIPENAYVYFVHSYYAVDCEDSLAATADYGIALTAAVEKGNIFGCQFHPEKSGSVGLEILRSFCTL